jgi:hypothetical protein
VSIGPIDPRLLDILAQIKAAQFSRNPVAVVTPALAGAEFAVYHGLGVTPTGFVVVSKSAPCDVYASGRAWDKENVYLRATAANATISLLFR